MSKAHDYKAHFTRTRSKYDAAMEVRGTCVRSTLTGQRKGELQAVASKVIAKQQKLQEEVEYV